MIHLNIAMKLLVYPVHKLAVVFHPLNKRYSHEQMFDPGRCRKGSKLPMSNVIKREDWMLAIREIVEVDRQTKSAHQIEGVVFQLC